MAEEKAYNMEYECCNCYTKFTVGIPMGTKAMGNGGKCPHCGVETFTDDDYYYTHKVLGRPETNYIEID